MLKGTGTYIHTLLPFLCFLNEATDAARQPYELNTSVVHTLLTKYTFIASFYALMLASTSLKASPTCSILRSTSRAEKKKWQSHLLQNLISKETHNTHLVNLSLQSHLQTEQSIKKPPILSYVPLSRRLYILQECLLSVCVECNRTRHTVIKFRYCYLEVKHSTVYQ